MGFILSYRVIESMLYGAWMMGVVLIYSPNVNMALISAENILNLLDRKPKIEDPPNPLDKPVSFSLCSNGSIINP